MGLGRVERLGVREVLAQERGALCSGLGPALCHWCCAHALLLKCVFLDGCYLMPLPSQPLLQPLEVPAASLRIQIGLPHP